MKYLIHKDKVEVTKSIKNYIEEKLSKLDKYFNNPTEIEATVLIKVRGLNQKIEITIPADIYTLRCEVEHNDLYAAIDLIVDKLERQIRKNKTKILNKIQKPENLFFSLEHVEEIEEEEAITKRKKMEMKPMDEEEAILQMNLLGHDFFVFKNIDTECISVLYKRKDGKFGIIDTK